MTGICTKLHQIVHHAPDLGRQGRPDGASPTEIRPRNVYQRPLCTRHPETRFPNRTQEADGSIPFISQDQTGFQVLSPGYLRQRQIQAPLECLQGVGLAKWFWVGKGRPLGSSARPTPAPRRRGATSPLIAVAARRRSETGGRPGNLCVGSCDRANIGRLKELVEALCSDMCAGRAPGTPGGIAARLVSSRRCARVGLDVTEQPIALIGARTC